MGQVVVVKQGDLFPVVDTTVKDELGNPVDLTGCTCKFSMRDSRDPTSLPVNLQDGALVNGPLGKIRYSWLAGQTDIPGTFEAEFLVDPVVGANFKVPTRGYITVIVEPKVA